MKRQLFIMFCDGTQSSISVPPLIRHIFIWQEAEQKGENLWISSLRILQMPCAFLKPVSLLFKSQRVRVLSGRRPNRLAACLWCPWTSPFSVFHVSDFFFKGFRWLVSKQLLRMGAIEVDGCEAGRMDAERLWQS